MKFRQFRALCAHGMSCDEMKSFFERLGSLLCLPSFGSFTAFAVVSFFALVLFFVFEAEKDYIDFMMDGAEYNGCYSSMASIEEALFKYSAKNGGKFPKRLSDLTPKYIRRIPFCPAEGADTYSSTYVVSEDCREYFFKCGGSSHERGEGVPQAVSDLMRYPYSSSLLPMKVVYEKGRMPEIMDMSFRYRRALNSRNYSEALKEAEGLLGVDSADRRGCMTRMAAMLFAVGRDSEALAFLERSLKSGFRFEEWSAVSPFIPESGAPAVSAMLKKYALSEGSDDPEAVTFAISFCDGRLTEGEVKTMCNGILGSEAVRSSSARTELFLRGMLAKASGDRVAAENCFVAIRDFPCGTESFESFVCGAAERMLGKV